MRNSSRNVGISLNMNPRWVGESGLNGFLDPLRQVGLDTLEFELDCFLPEWDQMKLLIEDCSKSGMKLCFHAPYRNPNRIDGFSGRRQEEEKAIFRPMLSIAQDWGERAGMPVNVVFHGARSTELKREVLRADTIEFLRWVFTSFPDIHIALENNHPPKPGEIKIGDSRAGVLDVIDALDHPNLGVCWDLGHDYLSHEGTDVDQSWLSKIIHVHIHDVNAHGIDHFPLVYGNVPYSTWLPLLHSAEKLMVITLELKGGLMMGWSWNEIQTALINSIKTIKQAIV